MINEWDHESSLKFVAIICWVGGAFTASMIWMAVFLATN